MIGLARLNFFCFTMLSVGWALCGCLPFGKAPKPRLVVLVGVDVSGSFRQSGHFENALEFLSTYLSAHLEGFGELEKPAALFVGSIGGTSPKDPKTIFPIETFQGLAPEAIHAKLQEIFRERENPYTDFNAFFQQTAELIQARRLVLKPLSIVLFTDGIPDFPGKTYKNPYRKINLTPLERLSRNISVRLLYTTPQAAAAWRTQIPRRRIKVWTQDAAVMQLWKDQLDASSPFSAQTKLFQWIQNNVDFGVRAKRID